jgi:hypothetical protein
VLKEPKVLKVRLKVLRELQEDRVHKVLKELKGRCRVIQEE